MTKVEWFTRMYLSILSLVFSTLSLYLLLDPTTALSDHGIKLAGQPNSAFAEIRAYYCGTMAVMALIFLRGATWKSSPSHQKEALTVAFILMSFFVAARVYSYFTDGPPELPYSYVLWAVEAGVAGLSLLLLRQQLSMKIN
jgi:hypothetical protein